MSSAIFIDSLRCCHVSWIGCCNETIKRFLQRKSEWKLPNTCYRIRFLPALITLESRSSTNIWQYLLPWNAVPLWCEIKWYQSLFSLNKVVCFSVHDIRREINPQLPTTQVNVRSNKVAEHARNSTVIEPGWSEAGNISWILIVRTTLVLYVENKETENMHISRQLVLKDLCWRLCKFK